MAVSSIVATPNFLTTPFVQPTDCSTYWYQYSTFSTVRSDDYNPYWSGCQASAWDADVDAYVDPGLLTTLSPAVCPSGWTTVWDSTTRVLTTFAFCCSTGYSLSFSSFPKSTVMSCMSYFFNSNFTAILMDDVGLADQARARSNVLTEGVALHQGWTIMWDRSDEASLTSWEPPPTSTPISYSTETVTPPSTSSLPTSSPTSTPPPGPSLPDSNSLSTGAKAGIGVGVGIAGLLLIVGLIYFVGRERAGRMDNRGPANHRTSAPYESSGNRPARV